MLGKRVRGKTAKNDGFLDFTNGDWFERGNLRLAGTAHGFAHEHREWNGLRKELNGSSYNRIYEKRLEKIGAEYERYIELFEGRRKK